MFETNHTRRQNHKPHPATNSLGTCVTKFTYSFFIITGQISKTASNQSKKQLNQFTTSISFLLSQISFQLLIS